MDKVTVQLTARQGKELCYYMNELITLAIDGLDDKDLQERGKIFTAIQELTFDLRRWFPEETRKYTWFENKSGSCYINNWWTDD